MSDTTYFEIISDEGRGKVYPIVGDTCVIGREEGCDIVVLGALVSRRHAEVRRQQGEWLVEDLGSTNGITVNDDKVTATRLRPGDVVGVGPSRLRFEVGALVDEVLIAKSETQMTELTNRALAQAGSQELLRLFLEVAAALDAFDSVEKLLSRCGQLVVDLLRPACCMLQAGVDVWTYDVQRVDADTHTPIHVSKTVLERVREQHEALVLSTRLKDVQLDVATSMHVLGIRSAMGAPIKLGDEPVGLIYVDQRRLDEVYSEADLISLVGISRLIGAALAGSRRLLKLEARNRVLEAERGTGVGQVVGESPAMRELRDHIERRIGPVHSTVLLLGETGTGKSMVAEAIHLASPRSSGPLVKVNCAAIPRELIESELFGHEEGAFSGASRRRIGEFELASGGTLFLDEVGELDPVSQAKLLAVIQDRQLRRVGGTKTIEINVRLIAATNRDLQAEVEAGTFRADLYFRLKVVTLTIPPLRERREDIPALAQHLLRRACHEVGRRVAGISAEAFACLGDHDWPGNIRELANGIEHAVIFADEGEALRVEHLPAELRAPAVGVTVKDPLELKERELIVDALRRAGDNKRQAARLLGWYPQKLYSRLRKYGLDSKWD